jgi:uncharacterized protein (DUF1697 family)
MAQYIALLRAVNVGGTGKLPMTELREIAATLGFTDVQTYIQSGNLVFRSRKSAPAVKSALEAALSKRLGKPATVLLRSAEDLQTIETANPFPDAAPAQVLVLFLDGAPDKQILAAVKPTGGERLVAGRREVYLHFPNGMGQSKLKIPFADVGTGRNLNTLRALLKITFPL